MTRQSFLDQFYIEYDQITDQASPGIEPNELEVIASEVQESLVITNYNAKSNRLNEGFEESEKRTQDFGELVRYKNFSTFTPGFFDNSVDVTLPNTLITVGPTDFSDVYWFTVFEDCKIDLLDCSIPGNSTIYIAPKIEDTSHGELKQSILDPFRKPYAKGDSGKVLRVRSEGRVHSLITDGTFNVTEYRVAYIKKPLPIVLTSSLSSEVSELSDHKQRELLRKTVEYCLQITEQQQRLSTDLQLPKE